MLPGVTPGLSRIRGGTRRKPAPDSVTTARRKSARRRVAGSRRSPGRRNRTGARATGAVNVAHVWKRARSRPGPALSRALARGGNVGPAGANFEYFLGSKERLGGAAPDTAGLAQFVEYHGVAVALPCKKIVKLLFLHLARRKARWVVHDTGRRNLGRRARPARTNILITTTGRRAQTGNRR